MADACSAAGTRAPPGDIAALLQPRGGPLSVEDVESAQAHVHAQLDALASQSAERRRSLREQGTPPIAVDPLSQSLINLETHARAAEKSVGEITSELRRLDMAKRNVSLSIVTLRRLQMMVNSSFSLEQLCDAHEYREAASALQAVEALMRFFATHSRVEYVVQQREKILALRARLQSMVLEEYEHVFQQARGRWDAGDTLLPDAALVVDALGAETRRSVVDWYCTRQLREYRRVFRAVDEAGQLDNVPRRYAWFRRILRTYTEEHAPAFLAAWHVDEQLLALFAAITRDDLKSVLVRQQGRIDVDTLLAALHATIEFEDHVARQFRTRLPDIYARVGSGAGASDGAGAPLLIASTFAPYLGVFVSAQDRRLAEMMHQFAQQPDAGAPERPASPTKGSLEPLAPPDEPIKVLVSSTELFRFYRQTLERCAQLGAQAPLRELAAVYSKWLRRYATDVLLPALPARTSSAAEVRGACTVLNTADYCATTCMQLEQRLTEKLRVFGADAAPVPLDAERDAFVSVIATALQLLARYVYQATDGAFFALVRPETPWHLHSETVERSQWIDAFASAIEGIAVVVRHEVENKRYVRSWCDKAAGIVVTRFIQSVLRLRPVRQRVAAQLLADLAQMRAILVDMPHFSALAHWNAPSSSASAQAAYERYVDKGTARIAPVLRVLAAASDESSSMRALVVAYREHIGDQSLGNFQKVLDLKGIRRLDQNPVIEEFLASIDRDTNTRPSTSILSSLQLDPNADVYAMPDVAGERPRADTDAADAVGATSPGVRPATPTNAATRALPDWKKFGSMFGVLGSAGRK
ncbi:Vacuolar protein sorting-associated protein 53 [Malassezia sp. CBS 17886]|nr:Vacuolar protein sorting-associated protein 53 [Malassezia sp. CBS 17886]